MKKGKKLITATLITIIVLTAILITNAVIAKDEFYVGVTYCGDSAAEAKALIDKVKGYTNLFVLQSGTLLRNVDAINEIGNYAVNAGLHYIVYFGTDSAWVMKTWQNSYNGSWGNNFLGIYFGDEPGGKMLDGSKTFYDQVSQSNIMKDRYGVRWEIDNETLATYRPDGTLTLTVSPLSSGDIANFYDVNYYLNGTVTITTYTPQKDPQNPNQTNLIPTIVTVKDHSTLNYTYKELYNSRPFQTIEETAQRFVNQTKSDLNNFGPHNGTYLTSDYGLYWYDYLGGYDTVLAQLGWNHSTVQDVALVRGAANMQGKDWGTIITWKYMQSPYLASGDEIYDQMRTAYECGAKYVVIFNYAENMTGPYGTLKEEHFQTLERFWLDIVQNPLVGYGSVKAEAAFVLPKDCGWGLRNIDDTVWGLWAPSEEYQRFWSTLQDAIAKHGDRLDIVVDDPAYSASGKYSQLYYWNQTNP